MTDFAERISKLSPKRLTLVAMELNARLERLERRTADPIAVIGIGCRFPGGVDGPEALWHFLREGGNTIAEIPASRWDAAEFYDPNPDTPGKTSSRSGSFLDDVEGFDAKFFGIAPREAVSIDPHQRMLLEVAWQALEHAGQPPAGLAGSATGVFIAPGNSTDYFQRLIDGQTAAIDAYSVAGNAPSMAAGRLSYFLGLQGPSLAVDTACSSSLVAVHLAAQSLRTGECRMALAGGANMLLGPEAMIGLSKAHMLSPDGQCRTFDAGANGIGRGEGCGIIVLKRLADAIADGDNVLALIRSTAINQDGRSNGITAPNGPAQEAVIREALRRAGVQPADIDYVEAHGTGTPLGDPIEVRALGAVLREGRPADRPLLIGSIKTNYGHMEFAAGIAGLLKVVLALQHQEIPPHLNLQTRNPHIEWADLPLSIPTAVTPWRSGTRRRLAGVSAFGFSGTNAHVIVEEATPEAMEASAGAAADRPIHLMTVSARSEAGCREMAGRMARNLSVPAQRSAGDVAFTANTGRSHFSYRAAVLGRSHQELSDRLGRVANGDPVDAAAITGRTDGAVPEIAFLFTGQGSQYVQMGRELFETQPRFRQTLEQCDEVLRRRSNVRLLDLLYPRPEDEVEAARLLNQTAFTQPAIFAIEYALADLWQSWGIRPSAVFGHSLGEYVAACVAGVFSLEDGLALVAERARLMQQFAADGAMAAVFADSERVAAAIAPFAGTVSIAAINGPAHTVISGECAHVDQVLTALKAAGVSAKPLNVSRAFHSAMLDPMLPLFEDAASRVTYAVPQLELVSNLTGRVEPGSVFTNAAYWRRQTRDAVRFVDGVRALRASGCTAFLEIGPAPILSGMARECLTDSASLQWLPSLRKGKSDWSQMLESLAALFVCGADVDWQAFDAGYARRKVALPTYVFQHERFWPAAPRRHTPALTENETWRDWLYEFAWQADGQGGSVDASDAALLAPSEVALRATEQLPELVETHGAAIYDQVYPALDALSTDYIVRALRRLGWQPAVGDVVELNAFRRQLAILECHTRLLGRMLEILTEDGFLERAGEGWRVIQEPPPAGRVHLDDLIARFPMCHAELTLTGRCGEQMAEVLRGTCDPLQLLFPGGSTQSAEDLYERAPAFRIFNALAASAVASAISEWPEQRRVRVLELGAGTGGTSAYLLPRLKPERTEYVFTDISPLFLSKAEVKFRAYPFVTYRALDIERDPQTQGFANAQFDIVVASNVLHATADLDRTLRHARSLLAPGGLLVLVEGTQPQRFGDITVGLTDGWWRFTDTDVRSYALVSSDRWLERMEAAGFENAVSFPDSGPRSHRIFSNQSILVAAAPRSNPGASTRSWLICADATGVGDAVATAARSRGDSAILVETGSEYRRVAADRFQVRPDDPEDFRRLLSDVSDRVTNLEAVHLWSLDAPSPLGVGTADALDAAVAQACGSALHLTKALVAAGAPASRLTLVTRGAQAVTSSGGGAADVQAPVWGLGRAIELEHPELRCTRVDLDPVSDDRAGSRLYDLLSRPDDGESQRAIRGDAHHVLRVARAESASTIEPALEFRTDATYLITGGLSGLGLLVAGWMAKKGARHLVLMGRRDPSATAQDALAELTRAGVNVSTVRGDVSCEDDLRRVLAAIDASGQPLRGVMHAAGVLDDGVLAQQHWSRFARVMAPKVRGTWLLDRLTRQSPLDFFVLFSSGASFLGSPGQSNHAAANAYIDAVAHRRRAEGLPALSINWGAWSGTGAATHGDVVDRAAAQGLGAIDPDRGLRVLEHTMKGRTAQIAVLPIHWQRFATGVGASVRLFEHVIAVADAASPQVATVAAPVNAAAWLADVTPGRLRPMLVDRVHREALRIMRLDPSDAIELRQPLSELGLDSLMAVELRNALSTLTGRTLSGTLLFNYPTIDELVDHLAHEIEEAGRAADSDQRAPSAGVDRDEIDSLSTDDVAKLLAARLQEM